MAADPANADVAYVVTSFGGGFKTTDAGLSWQSITGQFDGLTLRLREIIVDPVDSNTVYLPADVDGARFWVSIDAGQSWVARDSGLAITASMVEVDPSVSGTVYASDLDGRCRLVRQMPSGRIRVETVAARV